MTNYRLLPRLACLVLLALLGLRALAARPMCRCSLHPVLQLGLSQAEHYGLKLLPSVQAVVAEVEALILLTLVVGPVGAVGGARLSFVHRI